MPIRLCNTKTLKLRLLSYMYSEGYVLKVGKNTSLLFPIILGAPKSYSQFK